MCSIIWHEAHERFITVHYQPNQIINAIVNMVAYNSNTLNTFSNALVPYNLLARNRINEVVGSFFCSSHGLARGCCLMSKIWRRKDINKIETSIDIVFDSSGRPRIQSAPLCSVFVVNAINMRLSFNNKCVQAKIVNISLPKYGVLIWIRFWTELWCVCLKINWLKIGRHTMWSKLVESSRWFYAVLDQLLAELLAKTQVMRQSKGKSFKNAFLEQNEKEMRWNAFTFVNYL